MENVTPPDAPPPAYPPATNEPVPQSGTFQKPADYYAGSAPPPPAKSGCGKWLAGCGIAGCLVIIVVGILGFWAIRGGAKRFMGFAVSKAENEVTKDMTPEVSATEREDLQAGFSDLRANLENQRVKVIELQPLFEAISDATRDDRVTPQEVSELTQTLTRINGQARSPSQ